MLRRWGWGPLFRGSRLPCPHLWSGSIQATLKGRVPDHTHSGEHTGVITWHTRPPRQGLLQCSSYCPMRHGIYCTILGNSGRPLDMNTNGMLNDLPTLQGKVSEALRTYTNEALKDAKASGYTGGR